MTGATIHYDWRIRKAPPGGRALSGRRGDPFFVMRKRVNFYIDHRNVHHRLEEHLKNGGRDYRWLDYHSLCESLLRKSEEMLGRVCLFTAAPLPDVHGRAAARFHSALIDALKSRGVRVVAGRMVRDGGRVKEKQTDVNLAVQMTADALRDERLHACYVMSGDVDFAGAMKAVRDAGKIAGLVRPPSGEGLAFRPMWELVQNASLDSQGKPLVVNLPFHRLRGHALPETIRWRGRSVKIPPECAPF